MRGWTEFAQKAPGFHSFLATTAATLSNFTNVRYCTRRKERRPFRKHHACGFVPRLTDLRPAMHDDFIAPPPVPSPDADRLSVVLHGRVGGQHSHEGCLHFRDCFCQRH
jgi:hypothetical protein